MAAILITLEDSFVSPTAGVTFLAQQPWIQALFCWGSLGTLVEWDGRKPPTHVTLPGFPRGK